MLILLIVAIARSAIRGQGRVSRAGGRSSRHRFRRTAAIFRLRSPEFISLDEVRPRMLIALTRLHGLSLFGRLRSPPRIV